MNNSFIPKNYKLPESISGILKFMTLCILFSLFGRLLHLPWAMTRFFFFLLRAAPSRGIKLLSGIDPVAPVQRCCMVLVSSSIIVYLLSFHKTMCFIKCCLVTMLPDPATLPDFGDYPLNVDWMNHLAVRAWIHTSSVQHIINLR